MTEKRFKHSERYQDDGQLIYWGIEDTEKRYVYNMVDRVTVQMSEEQLIDLLDDLHEENMELKQQLSDWETSYDILKEEKRQILKVIDKKINELEKDYEKSVKAGMPTMSIYSEIELLEDLKKELQE